MSSNTYTLKKNKWMATVRARNSAPVYSNNALWDLSQAQAPVKAAQYFQATKTSNNQLSN